MASFIVIGLSLLLMPCGRFAAGDDGGCSDCCKNQTSVLKRISDATDKMVSGIREIEEEIDDDIPEELEKLSSELKTINASVDALTISLNKHSVDFLAHDARVKEQGLLLQRLYNLVSELRAAVKPVQPIQPVQPVQPKDCSDIRALGHRVSGVYRVYLGSSARTIPANVYCDMTTPGGNWLVFQRRKDGSVNFERTWIEYQNGFGNPSGEFWLGNDGLHHLTLNRKYKLRIDMEDFDGQKRYAEYSTFTIGSSADKYKLTVGGYTGNAGDSLSHQNGMKFSTKDADNDIWVGSCSLKYRGAWWYNYCHRSNLNGLYLRGPYKSAADGICWVAFRGYNYSLKTTEMKIAVAN